jgi:hypothetical protein
LENDSIVEGKMTYRDGKYFLGKFKNGMAHGEGVMQYPDGSSF